MPSNSPNKAALRSLLPLDWRITTSWSASRTLVKVSPRRIFLNYSRSSSKLNPLKRMKKEGQGWGWPSAGRSSRGTAARSGLSQNLEKGLHLFLFYLFKKEGRSRYEQPENDIIA